MAMFQSSNNHITCTWGEQREHHPTTYAWKQFHNMTTFMPCLDAWNSCPHIIPYGSSDSEIEKAIEDGGAAQQEPPKFSKFYATKVVCILISDFKISRLTGHDQLQNPLSKSSVKWCLVSLKISGLADHHQLPHPPPSSCSLFIPCHPSWKHHHFTKLRHPKCT